eukprot:1393470-Amorphochlora_amoeboformis.AAC.1
MVFLVGCQRVLLPHFHLSQCPSSHALTIPKSHLAEIHGDRRRSSETLLHRILNYTRQYPTYQKIVSRAIDNGGLAVYFKPLAPFSEFEEYLRGIK